MESHLRVEIVPRTDAQPPRARINGAEFPLTDFAVQYDPESGTPLLSLVLSPDSIQIGDPSTAEPAPEVRPSAPQVSLWGGGQHPDPRESIPGWEPSLGQQVANHAEQVSLRTWEPSDHQERTSAFARMLNGGGKVVTA